jgi:GPH family glycoside/pentoside/hexuronide:cation symporter
MASEAQDLGLVIDEEPDAAPAPIPVAPQPARLPTLTKTLFGIGSMADGAQIQIIGGLALLYYSQILHLPTPLVSLAVGMSLFIDAFWDLMIAQISDNLRTPLGRRHLLMYASALPAGLSFMALWLPPPHLTQGQLFAWLFGCILAFRFSHSVYMVPSGALLPELAPDYHDRTVLYSYRYMLGTIGAVIAAVLAYWVFLRATPAFPLGQLNPAGYPPMGIAVGVLIIVSSLISSLGTHSRIKGLYRPPKARFDLRVALGQIGSILNNHNFIVAVVAGMLAAVAAALTQGLAIYFNTYLFHLPSSNIGLLIGTQLVSAPIAFLLAPALSRRWGKRPAFMTLYLAALVVTHGPIALRLLGLLPQNGAPMLLPILLASNLVGGLLATSGAILNTSMIADIVEENQAKTGRRSEGVVLFCDRLLLKVASSLAAILPGILLALVHFPETAHPNKVDPAIVRNLALAYLPLTVGMAVLAMLTLFLFRIDREGHARNLAAIAARKAAQAAGEGRG